MVARRTKSTNDSLTDEQKKEILKDPELVKEILNTDQAKEEIAKLVNPEEITKIIEQKVAEQVGSQSQTVPEQYKQYGFIKEDDRSYRMVEI